VQAIYVPADDLTDPAPATSFAHLDAQTVLSRTVFEKAISGGRSARLQLAPARPRVIGQEHYGRARQVQSILQRYKSLQDIIAILGMDELSEDDKVTVARAGKIERFLRSRFLLQPSSPASKVFVPLADTIKSFQGLVKETTITCPSRHSTWSVPSRMPSPKPRRWRRKRRDGRQDRIRPRLAGAFAAQRCRRHGYRSGHGRLHGREAGHAPVISTLRPGTITVQGASEGDIRYFVVADLPRSRARRSPSSPRRPFRSRT